MRGDAENVIAPRKQTKRTVKVASTESILRTVSKEEELQELSEKIYKNSKVTENTVVNKIRHLWFSEDDYRQEIVNKAYAKWWLEFAILFDCESGTSPVVVWDWWDAYWLCQMNKRFHNIPAEYYKDRWFQVDYCYGKRKSWTKFYWPYREIIDKKTWKSLWQCKDYVKKRFKILQ